MRIIFHRLARLRRRDIQHIFFRVTVLFKGIDGVVETIGGITLLIVNRQDIQHFIHMVLRHELLEDPNDPVANYLMRTAAGLSANTETFAALYLLVHGAVKLGLVTALWQHRLWAYPLAGVVLSLFVIYQGIRFSFTHSVVLLMLTVIDVVIIALLPGEYHRTAHRRTTGALD